MKIVDVEFISDYICPWCYIGKVRIEKIKSLLKDDIHVRVHTKPYLLYPHIPPGGVSKSEFANKTRPGMGRSLKHEASIEGIAINYRDIQKIPNSLEAHRLTCLIEDVAQQFNLSLSIIKSYFTEGYNIESKEFLSRLAKEHNISEETINRFLKTTDGSDMVHSEIKSARSAYINIVPTLRINQKYTFSGLQSEEVWTKYIQRAARINTS